MKYLNAFRFMIRAIVNKKRELLISLAMVMLLLLIASVSMYFIERHEQPDNFSSIWATMWWGVATLTTVGYGDIYPMTIGGKILGGVIAILGVGLFALPAGIIASGFIEEIEQDKKMKLLKELEQKLKYAFGVEYFVPVINIKKALKLKHLPRKWLSLNDIKYKMGITEAQLMEVIEFSPLFRLRNVKLNGMDRAGLEYINRNRSYGQCINRQSTLTIVNLYASIQPYFGHFSMGMADLLNANYISNERYNKMSFLEDYRLNLIVNEGYSEFTPNSEKALIEIRKDFNNLLKPNSYCIFMVNAVSNQNLLQFNVGAEKGAEGFIQHPLFGEVEKLKTAYHQALLLANAQEMKILTHENNGMPKEHHVVHYLHRNTGAHILMLHVNVGILKKKAVEYYQYMKDIAACFKEFK